MEVQLLNIAKSIKLLYHGGELPFVDELKYLIDEGLLTRNKDILSITTSWIELSHKLNEDDFTSTISAINPELISVLLVKANHFIKEIALKKDKSEIFTFVDSLPRFAASLNGLKETLVEEEGALKYLFNGSASYQSVLRLLKNIQLIKKSDVPEISALSNEPDHDWIGGRIITTEYPVKPSITPNKFVMIYLDINNESIAPETKEILSQPWETFLVTLGMLKVEYRIEEQEGFLIKPGMIASALEEQEVYITLSSQTGRNKAYGSLKAFTSEICVSLGILLFPEKVPQINNALFALLKKAVFSYNGLEYILDPKWEERIYNKERFLKNKSRLLRNNLRSVIDRMRSEIC